MANASTVWKAIAACVLAATIVLALTATAAHGASKPKPMTLTIGGHAMFLPDTPGFADMSAGFCSVQGIASKRSYALEFALDDPATGVPAFLATIPGFPSHAQLDFIVLFASEVSQPPHVLASELDGAAALVIDNGLASVEVFGFDPDAGWSLDDAISGPIGPSLNLTVLDAVHARLRGGTDGANLMEIMLANPPSNQPTAIASVQTDIEERLLNATPVGAADPLRWLGMSEAVAAEVSSVSQVAEANSIVPTPFDMADAFAIREQLLEAGPSGVEVVRLFYLISARMQVGVGEVSAMVASGVPGELDASVETYFNGGGRSVVVSGGLARAVRAFLGHPLVIGQRQADAVLDAQLDRAEALMNELLHMPNWRVRERFGLPAVPGFTAADLDGSGDVDAADTAAFLTAHAAGEAVADFAAPYGTIDAADLAAFLDEADRAE